ncbi:zinc finger protein 786 isoform X1 [Ochotona curzoniae]|uniref:zinc finger protein 786-like isoform X1 n=1 Tax=Ochotona curzoniae TaxID=130825 RepID=UPI001B352DF7|nr:zinc finger protein 786-like isoform X1 [Ochotona curzoniae]XP_040858389.1 zinc finger protein 786 isoform X1 [Ochotona curzoniae]
MECLRKPKLSGRLLCADSGLPKPELISWIEQEGELSGSSEESQKPESIIHSSTNPHVNAATEGQSLCVSGSQQPVSSGEIKCHFRSDPLQSQHSFRLMSADREDVSFELAQGSTKAETKNLRRHSPGDAKAAVHGPGRCLPREGLPGRRALGLSREGPERPCPDCGESCGKKEHLVKHQRSHSDHLPHKALTCSTRAGPQQQQDSVPRPERHFRCQECGESFRLTQYLLRHLTARSRTRPFQCPECKMCFCHKRTLLSHRLTHKGERAVQLPACGKSFRLRSNAQAQPCLPGTARPGPWKGGRRAVTSVRPGQKLGPRVDCEEPCHGEVGAEAPQRRCGRQQPCACPECCRGFSTRAKLAGHLAHLGEKPRPCPGRGRCFRMRGRGGERRISCRKRGTGFPGEKPFLCAQCDRSFRQRGQLLRHQRLHTEKPFRCLECGQSFRLKGMLRTHRLRHGGERPFSCGECGRGFTHQCKLREHLRVHSGERPFRCPECDKSFRLKGILKAHLRTHSKERPFSCGECGKGFTRQSKLTEHFRVHSGERPFPCPQCERSFRLKGQLLSHQRLHTGERPFQCPECGKSYRVKADMKAHQLLHSGKMPFSCECGKGFAKQSKLIEHIRTHTGEKPFQCPKCDKSFRLKAQLLSHQGLHTGERPFHCPECDKNFRERGHMLRHQRIHRPDRPFACGDCGKGFIYKSKLAEHARVHAKSFRPPAQPDVKERLSQLFAMIEADWS